MSFARGEFEFPILYDLKETFTVCDPSIPKDQGAGRGSRGARKSVAFTVATIAASVVAMIGVPTCAW